MNNFSTFAQRKNHEMTARKFHLFYLFLFLLTYTACRQNGQNGQETISADVVNNPNSASGNSSKGSLPVIQFEDTEHDFGRIIEGESVSYDFKFKNTGKSDLIIAEVSTSCGCTVPSYPKTPIRPGESGVVKVAFSSTGKRGYQTKNVLVVSNTQPNTLELRIKAQVVNPGSEK
jgi:hypothetical protein